MSTLAPLEGKATALKTPQELVHIKHKITLLQYKYWVLMVRAYRDAYERGEIFDSDKELCYLPMSQLEQLLGYSPKTTEIEKDLEAIRREPIIFNVLEKDGKKAKTGRGFISEWYVSSNRIGVIFPAAIREAIKQLDDKTSLFHLLNWQAFNSFTGKYEAILYKLCKDYIAVGGPRPFSVEEFREYMGVKPNEYPDFKRLNQWVISSPIKRINESELSDILVTAEFTRERRKVVRIKFRVAAKKQTMMDFGDSPAFRFAKITIEPTNKNEYLALRAPEEIELCIERANEYAETQEKAGKAVNYGGLYRKAIEEGWHVQHVEKKQKKVATERAKIEAVREVKEKQSEEAQELQKSRQNNDALIAQFDALPDEQKTSLRAEYRATLVSAAMLKTFDKSGETAAIHRVAFARFMEQHFNK